MTSIDVKELDDEEVLLYLQLIKEDREANERLFNQVFDEFYNRHISYIYNVCLRYMTKEDVAKDMTQDVFSKIYQSIHTFDPKKLKRAKKHPVKSWIGEITKNLCLNKTKQKKTQRLLNEEWQNAQLLSKPSSYEKKSKKRKILDSTLETFSEKDKDLLYVYYNYIPITLDKSLPKGILPMLAKQFNVEPENFSKKRQRLLKRLKQLITKEDTLIGL